MDARHCVIINLPSPCCFVWSICVFCCVLNAIMWLYPFISTNVAVLADLRDCRVQLTLLMLAGCLARSRLVYQSTITRKR